MIKDDALASRLNAVKKGEEIPIPPAEDIFFKKPSMGESKIDGTLTQKTATPSTPGTVLVASILNLIETLGMAILFGIGLKSIFSTDWKFWGILGVGVITYEVFNLIRGLKLFN